MTKLRLIPFAVLLAVGCGLSGCAEYASIYSYPAGAEVYIDGKAVGSTPMSYRVPRGSIAPLDYRLEKEYYEPVEGTITPRVAPGRVVGAIFTLTIVYWFKSPYYMPSTSRELTPLPVYAKQSNDNRERLKQLEDLRSRGLLSEAEYEKLRREILDGL